MAKGVVPVYATEGDAMKSPSPPVIAELTAGQSVPVMECVDVKHYIVYRVRLPNGREGFVLEGTYTIMRDGEQAYCP